MKRGILGTFVVLLVLVAFSAQAHIGSPDVFYEGAIGPYPARVTIRMPTVVPGRAQIFVSVLTNTPVEASFRPLFSDTPVTNAPPSDIGHPLAGGEPNQYAGELWLMTSGGYSIEVKLHGAKGEGAVEIPVNSVALHQMPLPGYLKAILVLFGIVLVAGGVAIIMGAARDSTVMPGMLPGLRERRKGWIAGAITSIVIGGALVYGNNWWKSDEKAFRQEMRTGAPPRLTAKVHVEGSQRILRLNLDSMARNSDKSIHLLPDHNKLLHLFLIRSGTRDAFAHLHPIRKGGKTFELALPPLPAGRYDIFCDLTLEGSGLSCTATNTVEIPTVPAAENVSSESAAHLDADPDDSWSGSPAENVPSMGMATNSICQLPGGLRVVWKPHGAIQARAYAGLQFQVLDANGKPARLEPYMGMMSHAAVLRKDGGVFAHLHPSGNYSMAAQDFYDVKLARELKDCTPPNSSVDLTAMIDHSKMSHTIANPGGDNSNISLPYEFPSAGDYRLWVQVKTGGRVLTAVFDTKVE